MRGLVSNVAKPVPAYCGQLRFAAIPDAPIALPPAPKKVTCFATVERRDLARRGCSVAKSIVRAADKAASVLSPGFVAT